MYGFVELILAHLSICFPCSHIHSLQPQAEMACMNCDWSFISPPDSGLFSLAKMRQTETVYWAYQTFRAIQLRVNQEQHALGDLQ
jgi:hypothetical protein